MGRKTVYNTGLVTEEKWGLVNKENKDLMNEFLRYLGSVGRSSETIHQYENDLRIFFCWYVENGKNKHFTEIKKREVANFQGYMLNDCGMSSSRIRRMRSTLSSLSNFIESVLDDEYEDFRNIINKIEAPVKNPVRDKTIFTFEEAEEVAEKLMEKGKVQVACFLMVAVYSGLRKQELLRLKVKDFTSDANMSLGGSFYKTTPIRVKGRGNKTSEKYIWNKADKWLKAWLSLREKSNIECEYLFCKKNEDEYVQFDVSTANSFATTIGNAMGREFYMHSCRGCFATRLTVSGLPIDVVQFLLGHADASTTQIYISVDKADSMLEFADFFSGKVSSVSSKKKGFGDL